MCIRDRLGSVKPWALTHADTRAWARSSPVSYTHLDVYKRQDWATVKGRSRELLDSLDVSLPVDTMTGTLSVAQQQMVEIAKALNRNTRILVMDEPSAVLSERDIDNLFQVVRRLQASGIGIIYISHRLKEIFELADEVTVLKDGRYVDTRSVADVDMDDLVKLMIGRDLADVYPTRVHKPGDVVLQLSLIHI